MKEELFSKGLDFLRTKGLNLLSVLDVESLPNELKEELSLTPQLCNKFSRLVLIGNGGRQFWETFKDSGVKSFHPIDDLSETLAEKFMAFFPGEPLVQKLFPPSRSIPLQKLGKLAGWSNPSLLGQDIHFEFGLWFAYRSAFLTDLNLPLIRVDQQKSVCDSCQGQDCIAACHSGAVAGISQFDVSACVNFRMQVDSTCADNCAARLACPFAAQHRYRREQIRYHYTFSLNATKKYFKTND